LDLELSVDWNAHLKVMIVRGNYQILMIFEEAIINL